MLINTTQFQFSFYTQASVSHCDPKPPVLSLPGHPPHHWKVMQFHPPQPD